METGRSREMRIAAIVVTYNRKRKLQHCIDAVLAQKAGIQPDIIVVDNNSSDGTPELFSVDGKYGQSTDHVLYFNTGLNTGGAGGFCFGIRKAAELGYDHVWLMDDDCVPAVDALQHYLDFDERHKGRYGFLTGKVLWRDGSLCRMNIQRETVTRNVRNWERDWVRVEMASFVSLFIPMSIVGDVGLPIREFRIWTDDWEYTRRISRKYPCWLITGSTAVHDMEINTKADIVRVEEDRLWRLRYMYRNDVYLYRREGLKGLCYEALRLPLHVMRIALSRHSLSSKLDRAGILIRGTAEGLRFGPAPERLPACVTDGYADMTPDQVPRMKILEAFGEPISYGGQESFVMNVLDHMDRTGMSIDLLTPYYCDNQLTVRKIRAWGDEVYALGAGFEPGSLRLGAIRPIAGFLAEHSYDLIHIHSSSNIMLWMYTELAQRAGIPRIIVHSHSTGNNDWKHKVSKLATSPGLRRYPTDHCACSAEAGEWRFPESICRSSLRVITDGIDAEEFRYDEDTRKRIRTELGIDDEEIIIGCVGRLVYQKNQIFLIGLLKEIRALEEGRRYRLLLVGGGDDEQALRGRAAELGLQDAVIFAGVSEKVSAYYQAMDVLAVPSKYEGFGMVVTEGQAAGLDVIASDRIPAAAGITDSVRFIDLEDRQAWIDAIMSAHERHTQNADMIEASDYGIGYTVRIVRDMYLGKQIHDN